MSWHNFIFSIQLKYRVQRHVTWWLLWWVFIVFTVFITSPPIPLPSRPGYLPIFIQHQPGLKELGLFSYSALVLLKSFLLVSFHVLFCYAIIYVLLPAFQRKRNYFKFIMGILLVCTLMIPVGYFLYSIVYPFIDNQFNLYVPRPYKQIFWMGVDAGLINGIKVTLAAVAVTLLKKWWLKQKEKEQLEKERINAEVQLLKAQIHPAFLFSTLNSITSEARLASSKAPEMLIKLSDLLSYMLYECEAQKVKLGKELGMIREYMELEKLRQGGRLEMTYQVKGDVDDQMIAPLLLLPFIDNSFSYSNNELVEQAWVNLDIVVEKKYLTMKLINGRPAGMTNSTEKEEQALANVRKRLALLYPESHDLKISAEQELLMVYLHITLEQDTAAYTSVFEISKPALSYAGV
jgi:hypothetical protein